jgi:osmotically-inducible protein OsmY
MLKREPMPDHLLNQKVMQQLSNRGVRPPCKVAVSTQKGSVTLSGLIQYEHQRHMAMQAAQHIEGVKRVVDQLRVIPRMVPKKIAAIPTASPPV